MIKTPGENMMTPELVNGSGKLVFIKKTMLIYLFIKKSKIFKNQLK